MADSSNSQYSDPGPMFGAGDYGSTGAPGSPSGDDPLAMVPDTQITIPGLNVQVDGGQTFVSEHGQLTGVPFTDADILHTGAGMGRTMTRHPNSSAAGGA